MLEATELALPIVQAITADDAAADLDPEAVMQLLGIFQELVNQAIALWRNGFTRPSSTPGSKRPSHR